MTITEDEIRTFWLRTGHGRDREIIEYLSEKGKQSKQNEIDAILLRLKENMELGGYKVGWDVESPNEDNKFRQGQFSVYEWLLREFRKTVKP